MASDAFSLSLTSSLSLSRPRAAYSSHEESALKRAQQGLLALLLSLKVRPLIRYQASSEAASKLALELTGTISGERELFTFSKTGSQTLLVRAATCARAGGDPPPTQHLHTSPTLIFFLSPPPP